MGSCDVGQKPLMKACIKDHQHFGRVTESLQIFYLRKEQTDIIFVCASGRRIFAHKLVLCSRSENLKKVSPAQLQNSCLLNLSL